MKTPRRICVVTGTRAEYGVLYWLLKSIKDDADLELQIIATGMHLSHEFGLTYRLIEADGFTVSAKIEMLLSSDTPVGVTKSLGLGVIGLADALADLQPDILVLTGDRYEMLAAAQAGLIARIPMAHIGGGEATEGLIDEAVRHSITKMSHLHFVSTERYRKRVIQLGEPPKNVKNFGAINIDNIVKLKLKTRDQLERTLGLLFGKTTFLITYHPVTLDESPPDVAVKALVTALDAFPEAHLIFTKANADTRGRIINDRIDEYVAARPSQRFAFVSVGQLNYLSLLAQADAVIGNSSSGIIEAPSLKTPTVNVGARQRGRVRAPSIVDCDETPVEITRAIRTVLSGSFTKKLTKMTSPYGAGNASRRITDFLKDADVRGILFKKFEEVG
jgi:GDP/UDP-N,N'-diacetylbacillosamine 2-epimerase (hydrolysing)